MNVVNRRRHKKRFDELVMRHMKGECIDKEDAPEKLIQQVKQFVKDKKNVQQFKETHERQIRVNIESGLKKQQISQSSESDEEVIRQATLKRIQNFQERIDEDVSRTVSVQKRTDMLQKKIREAVESILMDKGPTEEELIEQEITALRFQQEKLDREEERLRVLAEKRQERIKEKRLEIEQKMRDLVRRKKMYEHLLEEESTVEESVEEPQAEEPEPESEESESEDNEFNESTEEERVNLLNLSVFKPKKNLICKKKKESETLPVDLDTVESTLSPEHVQEPEESEEYDLL